ncbi:N-acetylmuramoyl-L-alanine amidase [Aeromicrobium wangtongii]|uniref:N-acetylmuramoyl-L-alanine amidase n=1 Tax=Aeromicrobium wangtongii TaxID=2969247 RepID=A0ABY5M7T4_9ACTN|nr:N-acetylmuramoyl-L-alanine amidase [Aeromicrobium wangtongii]MCD9198959.1 N-acetylmuramoyl-L-alanine amidase [Aeromicrobium wangtongii]UUP13004.1 N-acetylmuramoyl-L-alanine amidase [Aeromicrobium wangtongii]
MRYLSGAIAGAVLATSVTFMSSSSAQADEVVAPAAEPAAVSTTAVPAPADTAAVQSAAHEDDLVAELPPRGTDEFGMVGVTWDEGFDATGIDVEVRLRSEGVWGAWQHLHVESDDEGGRPGTEPLWVGSADGVAVRVASPTGQRPAGLQVSTIDPGATPAATTSPAMYSSTADVTMTASSAAATPRPAIIYRSGWGATKNTKCDSPTVVDKTLGAVVHHTAGTNSYTREQSASIVRATQAYHMKSRKWCDIGYNFLVDKYGQIFEGRNGGVDKQVRAAHSGNASVNTYAMGISMMGSFQTSAPTSANKAAVVKLIAWRFGIGGVPATGTYSLGGKTLNRISGHRDVVGTECPGAAAYAWLSAPGGLRQSVSSYVGSYTTEISVRAAKLGVGATGAVVAPEYPFYSAPGGTKARYKKIDIISSPMGTYSIGDVVRSRYNSLSAQSGALGVPTGIITTTKRSQVRHQRFHHGTIYRVKRKNKKLAAFALYGRLENKYRSLNEASGKLGVPTKTHKKLSGGRERAWFTKGTLTLEKNGRVTVSVKK